VKKYRFKLERVLDLKRLKESLQMKELGLEVNELLIRKNKVEDSRDLKNQFDHRYHEIGRKGKLEVLNFRLHQSYRAVLGYEIKKGEKQVEEQKLKVDQVRERVRLAHQKTKSFEMLKEKSFNHYLKDLRKEEERELNQIGINRTHLRKTQSGQALMVLMAIGSTVFLMGLLALGLMFLMGNLTFHKLTLITQIIRYDQDYEKAYKVMGLEDPYVVMGADYLKIREKAEMYDKWQKGILDNEVVITQEILDHRKDLLERLERNLVRIRDDIKTEAAGLVTKEDKLKMEEQSLAKERMAFESGVETKQNEKMKKAQDEILKSFNSMDPADVVNVLTGGKTAQQMNAPGELQAAIEKVSGYLSQMSARQRAGVLQAMDPQLASPVVNHLEANFSL